MARKKSTSAALQYIHRRFFAGQPERLAELEEARASAEVARKVYDQTVAEFFLVVRCTYADKEGSSKGGDDHRVARRKQLTPQPKPRTVPRPEY